MKIQITDMAIPQSWEIETDNAVRQTLTDKQGNSFTVIPRNCADWKIGGEVRHAKSWHGKPRENGFDFTRALFRTA